MHAVTFYSYKGGVGRTLALANVAAAIVGRGESVFVMDFDLEAPGLQTFPFLSGLNEYENVNKDPKPGLTDLVLEYFNNPDGGVPDLNKFVTLGDPVPTHPAAKSEFLSPEEIERLGEVFFLSAGTKDAYEKIRWRELYAEKDGYIFFEALKNEIAEQFRCDWMLVDSRTGRAETTGICTRQLADTNVLLFFPNEQNRIGFEEVYPMMRDEPSRQIADGKNLDFIFVASRVPTGDDERDILENQLKGFADTFQLEDVDELVQLPHNNAVELLDQSLFVRDRSKTGLGRGYIELTEKIIQKNLSSRIGLTSFLSHLNRRHWFLMRSRDRDFDETVRRALKNAESAFPNDRDLSLLISQTYSGFNAYSQRRERSQDTDKYKALLYLGLYLAHEPRDIQAIKEMRIASRRSAFNLRTVDEVSNIVMEELRQDDRPIRDVLSGDNLFRKSYHSSEKASFSQPIERVNDVGNVLTEMFDEFYLRGRVPRFDMQVERAIFWFVKRGRIGLAKEFLISPIWKRASRMRAAGGLISALEDINGLDQMTAGQTKVYEFFKMQIEPGQELSDTPDLDDVLDDANIYGRSLMSIGKFKEAAECFDDIAAARDLSPFEKLSASYNSVLAKKLGGVSVSQEDLVWLRSLFISAADLVSDANFLQCFGVVLSLLSEFEEASEKFLSAAVEASKEQEASSSRGGTKDGKVFSTFNYKHVAPHVFIAQCHDAAKSKRIVDIFSI